MHISTKAIKDMQKRKLDQTLSCMEQVVIGQKGTRGTISKSLIFEALIQATYTSRDSQSRGQPGCNEEETIRHSIP
ncbi:hypothetical protein M514_20256 [Trichuris suis]|uniref:Uncharacterized protein n=1 Tax=Trichuris suis TaxID=68888 RepID=A0A085NDM9_9BILA|nr:hypothetical protein M513_03482 [Trichuris suis]KFD59552.1 hypothetical protein M514_28270 [Trichuris suis]KFD67575.1 hypothetical protein M514_03482 [Trichuris suis]KFD67579.1 hypothetical protein M514_20256 [Trichuris suis]